MNKKAFCMFLAFLVIANVSIKISYSLKVEGYDSSARGCDTYVELSTGETIIVREGETRVIKGNISCKIVRRAEVAWHEYSTKTKPHLRISLRKIKALKSEPMLYLLALVRNRSKVLLFSPELPERTYPGRPPIFYLSSILRRKGFDVSTIDVDITGRKEFIRCLSDFNPDVIGGTSLSIQINEAMNLMKLGKKYCPKAITILGGIHATAAGEYLYPIHADYLDAVAIGEGLTTIELVAKIAEENRWDSLRNEIPGLLQWDGSKSIKNPAASAEHPDRFFPDLPHHSSYDFSIFEYQEKGYKKSRKTFQCMTAFGCTGACFFCSSSTNLRGETRRCERRMNLSVVESILRNAVNRGYQAVYFDDDTFTRNREHALKVARLCKKYDLVFGCHTRPDCEDEELIREFAVSGCMYVFSGLETIVPEILLAANKTRDPVGYRQAYLRSYRFKNEVGIPVSAFMIHGMPRRIKDINGVRFEPDTLEDSRTSIEFAVHELDPTYLSMNVLRFLPNVPFSFASQFDFLRPSDEPLHGGYWDKKWLKVNGKKDPRCFHPILRAFEGSGSAIPAHMTPERCYRILEIAVDIVNRKNVIKGTNNTRIVVDSWFEERFLKEVWSRGVLQYKLAPFEKITSLA